MNSTISASAQDLPHLQSLVEKIDELLELRAVSHHDYLRIRLPKGLLHWPIVTEAHVTKTVSVELGVMGTSLEITITPRDVSDTSSALVDTGPTLTEHRQPLPSLVVHAKLCTENIRPHHHRVYW